MAHLLNLVRQLLEYYGMPPELLIQRCEACLRNMVQMIASHLPSHTVSRAHFDRLCTITRNCWVTWSWERKKYGSSRSFVRQLAKCLSLTPCPRPHFQLVRSLTSSESEQNSSVGSDTHSLTDILWMADNGKDQYVRFRTDEWSEILPPLPVTVASRGRRQNQILEEDAFKKMSALENELAHLRAQIAIIVAAQKEGNNHSYSDMVKLSNTALGTLLQPSMTSTPLPSSHCTAVVPPPPPPPPLPPSSAAQLSHVDSHHTLLEHTKQCQAESKIINITDNSSCQKDQTFPSMMEVLKDINKVKLRAVERSPGGTPLPKREKIMSSQWDPAALIAKALKEKFASQNNGDNDSFDKENSSCGSSLFSSPQTPKVSCHILKPSMKQTPARDNELMQKSATKRPVHI